jgi:hypothetical protein
MLQRTQYRLGLVTLALVAMMLLSPAQGHASGGREAIKVNKCEYAVTGPSVELLISASSSDPNVILLAYLPDGSLLGPVHNGGPYGGTVYISMYVPYAITIVSSSGAYTTVPCVPFQP